MKKTMALILVAVLLLTTAAPARAALPETAVPYYANTSQATVSFVIEDDGTASWTIMCIGKSNCTGIDAETHLERKVGISWVRIGLGNGVDQYTYSTTESRFIQNNTHTITRTGTYRAVVVFTVYGTTENETITLRNEHDFGV